MLLWLSRDGYISVGSDMVIVGGPKKDSTRIKNLIGAIWVIMLQWVKIF